MVGDLTFKSCLSGFSMDDSETEREEQSTGSPAPSKKKCLFDDSIVGKVGITVCSSNTTVIIIYHGHSRDFSWFLCKYKLIRLITVNTGV